MEEWQPVGGLHLEPNAMAAVREIENNVVVTAGPGAGKTELLAQRADFLFRTGASPYPRRILAISFKTDAARNLQDRVRSRSGAQYAARFDSFTFHAFAKRLIDNYRPALTGLNALLPDYRVDPDTRIKGEQITFKEFVPFALEILEENAYARGALRQTYSHVFLDEFQDATGEQYSLVKAGFAGIDARLTAVGDVKQRIMAWAGALDGVMETFATDFAAESRPLYQNFRSKPRLRRMQNRMVHDMDPAAASPASDLVGDEGEIQVLPFNTDDEEAAGVADILETWLANGTPHSEIAVLIRNQPHLVGAVIGKELAARGIAYRNEQESQDLTAEPAAALILNFLRVVADDRRPDAYAELIRVATRTGDSETESLMFESLLRQHLRDARATVRTQNFDQTDFGSWRPIIADYLRLVPRSQLNALSPSYHQGSRLDGVLKDTIEAFNRELAIDGDAVGALNRLSEEDAVRFFTIHKCKGLEFEKVIVVGVETELFFGKPSDAKSEFFVAISRAKDELIVTHSAFRTKPEGANARWSEERTAYEELLRYAVEPA
ncbi:ATP-dependent helicase [Arthrobacter sp. zg-Y820]|uniref:UvrD-helicase domain-containing protein n=1 Tax=unclassified Arthrobacter TaxID=235627 RepID=UPI001E323A5C|nr:MULTISPECIES: ATP-dependent helicase [unclassified Arthrobacter]MCC9198255.1 ATP-dependent helicase [Arthrobacter sp. zg-Y820]MDK1281124.1 ATP-dependent helicase [Arthrobacter sp. zg.Y820]WIB09722.1 ATP-dependent helicase [Arthrobacter sp. zg-Y820]